MNISLFRCNYILAHFARLAHIFYSIFLLTACHCTNCNFHYDKYIHITLDSLIFVKTVFIWFDSRIKKTKPTK